MNTSTALPANCIGCGVRLFEMHHYVNGLGPLCRKCASGGDERNAMNPITPTPGPPNLDGVPDEAYWFITREDDPSGNALWELRFKDQLQEWELIDAEDIKWHVGPILPPTTTGKDGE